MRVFVAYGYHERGRWVEAVTNFRLEDFTFGTFSVDASVTHRDGRETILRHDLIVRYPDGRPAAA
jgi:hypothetical protein